MSLVRLAALAVLAAWAASSITTAQAQVYRIVGPDGRVTFSDRPPPDGNATPAKSLPLPGGAPAAAVATASLPLELRNTVTRYPVTLYTNKDCGPCGSARNFLLSRGVPFTEKTVSTEADVRALQQLSGDVRLPFATLGSQFLRGFSASEWSQYLDAAGYPRTSALPAGYQNPEPTPLVAVETPRPAEPPPPPRAELPPSSTNGLTPSNPAGIRF